MFVVTVTFTVDPARDAEFDRAMRRQAATSLRLEPDCLQFDVCRPEGQSGVFFLYEVYADRAAFDLHLASDHFRDFDRTIAPWVTGKSVAFLHRLDP